MTNARVRWLWFLLCGLGLAAPFAFVEFVPLTDLPQHMAQVRMFFEALGDRADLYKIQWLTPYTTGYALLGAAWWVAPPLLAARLGAFAIALAVLAAVHVLAASHARRPEAAVVASLFVFNHVLYWGFLPFLMGFPVFILWMVTVSRQDELPGVTESLWLTVLAALLFWSHALWFAAGVGWLAVETLLWKRNVRAAAVRLFALLPLILAAAFWFPKLEQEGFRSPPLWVGVGERLLPAWWVEMTLGGLRGPWEPVLLLLVAGWVAAGFWQSRARWKAEVNWHLLAAAIVFAAAALILPDKFQNTVRFSGRWAPFAAMFAVLGAPLPRLPARSLGLAAGGLFTVLCLATTAAWRQVDRDELAGLSEALSRLPAEPRVLGLEYLEESAHVRGRPFLQMFAYAQVTRGGVLNFSFADFAPSPVVYRERLGRLRWTQGLEWLPERVQPSDLAQFDFALVAAEPEGHEEFQQVMKLPPGHPTQTPWRLYRTR